MAVARAERALRGGHRPSLNLAGWYDIFVAGSVENFRGIRTRGGSAAAREGSRLIVGTWSHTNTTRAYPERSYGWGAEIDDLDPTTLHRRFFDRWVREDPDAAGDDPPVRLFVMGVDRWSDETDWPPPDAVDTPWFLHSGGRANSAAGDGALTSSARRRAGGRVHRRPERSGAVDRWCVAHRAGACWLERRAVGPGGRRASP